MQLACAMTTLFSCTEYPQAERFTAPEIEYIEATVDGTDALLTCRLSTYSDSRVYGEYGFEYWDSTGTVFSVKGMPMSDGVFTCDISSLESDDEYTFMAYISIDGRRYESSKSTFTTEPCLIDGRIVDEVFRNACLEEFDLNKDGHLSLSEADKVKEMQMMVKNSSFKGIDVFRNLESVWFSSAKADTLDLSRCVKLKSVIAKGCHLKALLLPESSSISHIDVMNNNLTEIDLGNCPGLEYLNCTNNMKLGSLDFSKTMKLKTLICTNCDITYLSLDGHDKLERLECGTISMTPVSLSITGCRSLKHLDISSLDKEMDFSAIPSIENLQLSFCYNQTSLDLSANTRLHELKIIDCPVTDVNLIRCQALKSATFWYDSNIVSLDFSRCRAISEIDCRYDDNLKTIVVPAGRDININKDSGIIVAESE